jgi:hypothetical protein
VPDVRRAAVSLVPARKWQTPRNCTHRAARILRAGKTPRRRNGRTDQVSDESKSVLRVAFERSPFWTAVALAMPFGMAVGLIASIVKMPRVKRRRKEGKCEESKT